MKIIAVMSAMLSVFALTACSGKNQAAGEVTMIVGKAWIVNETGRREAAVKDRLKQGDSIETGEDSVVIAEILDGTAQVEIQENALFRIESVAGNDRIVAIDKGNLWLRVNKLVKNGTFRMKTPTSIAAVRGTKMYHFSIGEMDGICHCEGDVDFINNAGDYTATHHRDSMVFVKGSSTVLLSPDDLALMNTPGQTHRHSALDNSILGPKSIPLTALQEKGLMKLVGDKLKTPETGGQK